LTPVARTEPASLHVFSMRTCFFFDNFSFLAPVRLGCPPPLCHGRLSGPRWLQPWVEALAGMPLGWRGACEELRKGARRKAIRASTAVWVEARERIASGHHLGKCEHASVRRNTHRSFEAPQQTKRHSATRPRACARPGIPRGGASTWSSRSWCSLRRRVRSALAAPRHSSALRLASSSNRVALHNLNRMKSLRNSSRDGSEHGDEFACASAW